MPSPFRVEVFGKPGCDKCAVLNQRLDKLLGKPEWEAFEKVYHNILSEEGLITFCEAECINPQRIPAFVLSKWDEEKGAYGFLPNPEPGSADAVGGKSRLYQYLGLQTDYSAVGRGVITPRMLWSSVGASSALVVTNMNQMLARITTAKSRVAGR